jgi:cell division transport system permease protein
MDKKRGAERVQPSRATTVEPQPTSKRGAEHHKVDLKGHSESWVRNHMAVGKNALAKLLGAPIATIMTVAVLAIALTLPGFLFTVLSNVQNLTQGWEGETRLSLYLETSLTDEDADRFSRTLLLRDDIAAIDFISRSQGMLEFKKYSGFGDVLDSMNDNPLPAVVVLLPKSRLVADLGIMRAGLQALPEVNEAVLDLEWLQRLDAMLAVAKRAVFVLGVLLGLAVLLVIGNTIKMEIESRRDEIVVSKLVGATDAWVRRPFLYTGVWYGLLGALSAWLIVQISWLMLETPAQELAQLYRSQFQLSGLGFSGSALLLFMSVLLGWLGAWVAVRRHLREIEPS